MIVWLKNQINSDKGSISNLSTKVPMTVKRGNACMYDVYVVDNQVLDVAYLDMIAPPMDSTQFETVYNSDSRDGSLDDSDSEEDW